VEEINKCLWIKGYCRRLLKRLSGLPHGKLPTRPQPSSDYSQGRRYQSWQRRAA